MKLLQNGRYLDSLDTELGPAPVQVLPCHPLKGGKGGFGSMLRSIGAQIERTTNHEAMRDLSGRRQKDVNNERRLKEYIAGAAERQKEAEEKKEAKLSLPGFDLFLERFEILRLAADMLSLYVLSSYTNSGCATC